jgi:tetratricopeptide (TPR) repeat protein
MKKRENILIIVIILIISLGHYNLWGGKTKPTSNELPFADRIRNIPAVSTERVNFSNEIYMSSFGLVPYRLSRVLIGQDAFLFRTEIDNSYFGWSWGSNTFFEFDDEFETTNLATLPPCGRNAYDEKNDLPLMKDTYGEREAYARFDGGTGSWASPVLDEENKQLIVLNKSGVIMGISSNFDSNYCVEWAFDLRQIERSYSDDHSLYEYVATPTVIGDNIFIPGIFHIFKIDLSVPNNYTLESARFIDDTDEDFFSAPLAFDLKDPPNLIAVSNKGRLVVVDYYLNVIHNDISNWEENQQFLTRPIVDADGQVYISSDYGKIYHFSQEKICPYETLDIQEVECDNHKFVSTFITDSTKKIYAFTAFNDILSLEANYDYSPNQPTDPIILYEWNDEYLYEHIDFNHRVVNNHSVLFERYAENTSCLLTLYNEGLQSFIPNNNYYHNFDPQSYNIIVRMFNPLDDISGTIYERCSSTATFGGIVPYVTNEREINAIWVDDSGYAWTWDVMAPTHNVNYPYDNYDPLINDISNPKFMKNLTNLTDYKQNDFRIIFHELDITGYDVYMNSYNEYDLSGPYPEYMVTFHNLLEHPNYNLAIITPEGEPYVFNNIDTSLEECIYYGDWHITNDTTIDGETLALFHSITVSDNSTLTIDGVDLNIIDLTLHNGSEVIVINEGELRVSDTLLSVDENTNAGIIANGDGISYGDIYITNIDVEDNGTLSILANDTNIFRIEDFNIVNGGIASLNSLQSANIPVCDVTGEFVVNGSFMNESSLVLSSGSNAIINGTYEEYGTLHLVKSNLTIENSGYFELNSDSMLSLKSGSGVIIDGTGSMLFLDWGSSIIGSEQGSFSNGNWIPGDRIIAQNGGIITTDDSQDPGEVITISSSEEEELWDGIFIKDPNHEDEFWFVNCAISGIRKLAIEKISESPYMAKLNLYLTDFQNAGEFIARDGHKLTIEGTSERSCNIINNRGSISAYESPVNLEYVNFGSVFNGNGIGIYLYDTAEFYSTVSNTIISNNHSNGFVANGVLFDIFEHVTLVNNDGFGMLCYDGTEFTGEDPFEFITIQNNAYAEYCGWQDTYSMENGSEITISDNDGSYLLINVDWDQETEVDISGTNLTAADLDRLDPDTLAAWYFGNSRYSNEMLLLNSASSDIGNGDYASAEQTLLQIISDYPSSNAAGTAVFYLYHIKSLTDQDFIGLIGFLESLEPETGTSLEKTVNRIIAKCYIKENEYEVAIDLLEDIINNSQDPDEIVLAMIDQGYAYLKLSETGERALPENSTVKTASLDAYQKKVRELQTRFSFYPTEEQETDLPVEGKISSLINYPNPFNPETTIEFSLSSAAAVSVSIYNIKGQKIKDLFSDHLPTGEHSVVWNGRDNRGRSVASGVYFYRITTGNDTTVKKMLLLK